MKQVLAGPWGCATRTEDSHETGVGWSLGLSQGQWAVMKQALAGHWDCHKDRGQS